MGAEAQFDVYADNYDSALEQAISVSGESKDYFARSRVQWTASRLKPNGLEVRSVLDYGCGTGTATSFLHEFFPEATVLGVDVSTKSLETAARSFGSDRATFSALDDHTPSATVDLAYCNGVFHHIPVLERNKCVTHVYDTLRGGGVFAFWENSPWSLATRYVMSRCEFDQDAVTLTPPEARQLLRYAGFEILRTDFLFIFPRALRWFRPLEPMVSVVPFGTQYLILCRKP